MTDRQRPVPVRALLLLVGVQCLTAVLVGGWGVVLIAVGVSADLENTGLLVMLGVLLLVLSWVLALVLLLAWLRTRKAESGALALVVLAQVLLVVIFGAVPGFAGGREIGWLPWAASVLALAGCVLVLLPTTRTYLRSSPPA